MLISCQAASRLISQSLDAPLSWQNRLALRLHLAICKHCTRFSQQLAKLRLYVKTLMRRTEDDPNIQLKPEAKQRIAEAIEQNL